MSIGSRAESEQSEKGGQGKQLSDHKTTLIEEQLQRRVTVGVGLPLVHGLLALGRREQGLQL